MVYKMLGASCLGKDLVLNQQENTVFFSSGRNISRLDIEKKNLRSLNFIFRKFISRLVIDNLGRYLFVSDDSDLITMIDINKERILERVMSRSKISELKINPRHDYLLILIGRFCQVWKFGDLVHHKFLNLCKSSQLHRKNVSSIEWDESGKYIISVSNDNLVKLWSFRDMKLKLRIPINFPANEISLIGCMIKNDKIFILRKTGLLEIINLKRRSFLNNYVHQENFHKIIIKNRDLEKFNRKISFASFFPKLKKLITGTYCGQIKVLSLGNILSASFNGERTEIVQHSKIIESCLNINQSRSNIKSAEISHLYPFLIFSIERSSLIFIFDILTKKNVLIHGNYMSGCSCVDISSNKESFCTGNVRGMVCQWILKTGLCSLKFDNHLKMVNGIKFLTRNSRFVLSCSKDATIKLFDFKKGVVLKQYDQVFIKAGFKSIDVDGKNQFFAVSSLDEFNIFLFGLKSGRNIRIFKGHSEMVLGIYFVKSTNNLLSLGKDRCLRSWPININLNKSSKLVKCYFLFSDISSYFIWEKENKILILTTSHEILLFDLDGFAVKKKTFLRLLNFRVEKFFLLGGISRQKKIIQEKLFFFISHPDPCLISYIPEKDIFSLVVDFPPDPVYSAGVENENYTFFKNQEFFDLKAIRESCSRIYPFILVRYSTILIFSI